MPASWMIWESEDSGSFFLELIRRTRLFPHLNTDSLTLFRVSTVTTATPSTQTKLTRWPTPSMGPSGGGRALLSPGDWSTTRWTSPWTLGRWDYHTLLCYEQLFTCWYLHVERWLLCGEGEMQHLDVTEGKCFVSWLLLCSPKMSFACCSFCWGSLVFHSQKTLMHDHIFSWSFITSAGSDHVNNVLQLDACQESDSRPPPPPLAGKHASIMTRVSGRGLARGP